MIKKRQMWYVVCNKCGEMYEDPECERYFKTQEEAKDTIESDDWWEIEGNRMLCPNCH